MAAQPWPGPLTPSKPPAGFRVAGGLVLFQAAAVLFWGVTFLITLIPPCSGRFASVFSAVQAAFLFVLFWPVGLLIALVGAKLRTMHAVITAVIMEGILLFLSLRSVGAAPAGFASLFWWSIAVSAAVTLALILAGARTWYSALTTSPEPGPAGDVVGEAASAGLNRGCGCLSVLPWLWAQLGFLAVRSSRAVLVVGLLAPALAIAANSTAGRLLPPPTADGTTPNVSTRVDCSSTVEVHTYLGSITSPTTRPTASRSRS